MKTIPQQNTTVDAKLQRLQWLERIDQIAAEMNTDPSKRIPFTKEELFKQGLISKEQLKSLND